MRKRILAIVMAMLAFGVFAAAAATLGGLNTADLGADATVVASCDTDGVDVDYNVAYDAVEGYYVVSEVVLSDINVACDGQTISVALGDGTAELDSGTATADASGTATITGLGADAEAVTQVAVVIAG